MSLLALSGIWKRFGATTALADAGFTLEAGEVHALVGANGAGKSTLSRIVSGHIQPDAGQILVDGRPVRHAGAREAIRGGITMVTQETSLAPDLSVLENIMLPRLGMRGRLRWRVLRAQAETLIAGLGEQAALSPDRLVRDLSIGQRQLVEILKALALDSRIIIFDEPTAPLSPHESELLFDIIRDLAARGRGLIFVSHRLEEIFALTDRVTVLREGRVVADGAHDARAHARRAGAADGRSRAVRHLCARRRAEFGRVGRRAGAERAQPSLPAARARCFVRRACAARSSAWPGWSAPAARKPSRRSSACAVPRPAASR